MKFSCRALSPIFSFEAGAIHPKMLFSLSSLNIQLVFNDPNVVGPVSTSYYTHEKVI